jgi:DNA-directed RNA polymerase subunit M/transcription elongation factor TFIIS
VPPVYDDFKVNIKESAVYKCPKCKENKFDRAFEQRKRADEPPTLVLTCVNCGHKIFN